MLACFGIRLAKWIPGNMRTRVKSMSLLAPLLLCALPAAAQAQEFLYTTTNGVVTITGYTGAGGDVIIPSTITGLPVTRIGSGAFSLRTNVISLTIPDSVTAVEDYAFYRSTSLTSVTLGNSIAAIGDDVFSGCISLTNVTIPDNVTSIGEEAFYGCISLSSVMIGNSVNAIGDRAFYNCASLTGVKVTDSVTAIGNNEFTGCTSLTSVTIGKSLAAIGYRAFIGCTNLNAITVDGLNSGFSSIDGVLFNRSQTTLIQYPCGKRGGYTIPNGVTNIWSAAFSGCIGLTSITIGNSVTTIWDGAFGNCASLTSVTIPNSVTNIGAFVFFVCSNLTSVTIPNSVTSIGNDAFYGCTSLPSVTIPKSVTDIGYDAFSACKSLTDVTIPDSVTAIGDHAFDFCTSLASVTIPDSVSSIGLYAFTGCSSLNGITVDALNSVYSSADGVLFNKNQTTLIQYPGGKVGSYTVPSTVTFIGDFAFARCPNLTSVTIPDSATAIGDSAFSGCTNLAGLYFQGNAPSLAGEFVFSRADNAIVYYVTGTTGWSSAFGGRPTAPWLLRIQAAGARFGVETNAFGFTLAWDSGRVVVVEACTNLASPVWSPLQTNTLGRDPLDFSDADWTNHPARFYRLRAP
jgi:hypothetical protein